MDVTRSRRASIGALVGLLSVASSTLADTTESAGLEEIVVTAQKRAEPTQKVPITIEAVTAEALTEARVDNLSTAQKLTPGVVFLRGPDEGVQLTFRGLGTPARNKSFEQSVGAFADGIFFGHPNFYIVPFFDVERLEFIKGTQSTLLGKNTSVGAISITSRRPGDTLGGTASVSREFENGGWTVDGGTDLPVSDMFKLRVAGHYKDQEGYLDNGLTGHSSAKLADRAGRLTAMLTPGDATITGIYEYADVKRTGSTGQVVTDDGVFHALDGSTWEARLDSHTDQITSHDSSGDGLNHQKVHFSTIIADLPVGDNTLTLQSAYAHLKTASVNPSSAGLEELFAGVRSERFHQFSQEIRFTSPTGLPLEYILGLYYFHSNEKSLDTTFYDVPGLFVAPGVQILNGDFANDFRQKLDSYSGFASATYHFSDTVRLAAGVRYTDEKKDVLFGRTQVGELTFWNTVANPPFPLTPLEFKDNFVNGNINLQVDLMPTAMVYSSIARGTKAGGFADSAPVPDANPAVSARIDSETATTYEVGLKSTLLDRRLLVNLSTFYVDVDDYQLTFFDTAAGVFVNVNRPARSYGFEVKTQAKVTDAVELSASATHANATDTGTDQRLPSAPLWSFNGSASYERSLGANLVGRLALSGHYRTWTYAQYGGGGRDGSYGTVDGFFSVGSDDKRWRVSLSGTNLFNSKTAEFGIDGGIDPRLDFINNNIRYRQLNPLRAVELGVTMNF
jgi:iron complex outermembrane receptor protein